MDTFRAGELVDAMKAGTALVVERHERITGYATVLAFFGHAVAETNLDIPALIASAEAFAGPGIIVPTRNSDPFSLVPRECLRVIEPMTLMTSGLLQQAGRGRICLPTLLKPSDYAFLGIEWEWYCRPNALIRRLAGAISV